MTTLATGDLHLNNSEQHRHDFMEKTLPNMIRKYNVVRLIILGDICDDKDHHGAWLVNRVVGYIHNLSSLCPITILKGNHDYIEAENPFFTFLSVIKNVTWIGKPKTLGQETFLPHTRDYVADWPDVKYRLWIFAHNTFQGAKVGLRTLEGIPLDIFPDGSKIISGDVHSPQTIKHNKTTLHYVGAPYRINFGDTYNPRVLLIDGNKVQSIPVPGPQKVLIEIKNGVQVPKDAYEEGDFLKVRIQISQDEFEHWPNYKTIYQKDIERYGGIVYSISPVLEQTLIKRMINTAKKSDEEQLTSYGKRRGISEKVLKTGLELMREA